MRKLRFQTWVTDLVDANLPADVKRIEWADTGINSDPDMGDHLSGLVFETPTGGTAYLRFVHGGGPRGDNPDEPETIVEGEPPAPVEPVDLSLVDGKLRMADVEAWLAALIVNSQFTELASIERFSTRPIKPNHGFEHRFGFHIKWHEGSTTTSFFQYTLAPGERRAGQEPYRSVRDAI